MDIRRRTFLGAVGTLGLVGCTDEDPDSEEIPEEFPEPETPRYGYGGTPVESTPTPTPTDRTSTPRIDQRIPRETARDDGSGEDNTTTQTQDPAEPASTPSTPETGGGGTNPNAGSPDSDTDDPTESAPDDTGTETNPDDTGNDGSGDQPPTGDSDDDSDDEGSDEDVLEEYTVRVDVTDETGTPIEADVTLGDVTLVTENGAATFEDVTAGDHRVEASAEGYRDESRTISVDSDTETTLSLAETNDQTEWCAAENEEYATQGYGEYGYGGVVPCA